MPTDWLRGAFDYAAIGMALISPDGRWLHVNQALCEFTGYAELELLDMTFKDIVHLEDADSHPALMAEVLAGKSPMARLHKRYRHKDGHTLWGSLTISAARAYLVVQIQDITEQKKLEEQLIQSQKLEAVGKLAGGIAHDFNNILTIINGYCEILLARELSACEMLREIHRASQRAAALTRQLLLFSRKQFAAPTHIHLNELIVDLAKMLGRIIGEDVDLRLSLSATGLIFADQSQVEQLLLNLAVNARDAMPHGGVLTVSTEDAGDDVLLSVRDDGCGMTDEVKTHLFEPFFTTKEVGKGTGLGLAVVKGVVQLCNGRIDVESAAGQGSCFNIYFPRAKPARPGSKAKIDSTTAPPGGSELVLLVEDEDDVRALSSYILRNCGYQVLEARSGPEALQIARGCPDRIAALVTDVVMPGFGGRELAEQLTLLHPETRTLYLSGYTDDEVVRYGVSHEQMQFLAKPFSPAALAEKVRATIDV